MMALNKEKLKTLVHYVAYRCIDEPRKLEPIKLNKALWFSDLSAYLAWGNSITGEKYIKKVYGPVASNLMWIVEELEKEDALAIRKIGQNREYLALTTPDASIFSGEEMRVIEDAIETVVHKHTSRSISEKSHNIVWELAELGEEIPFFAAHAGRLHEIETSDVDWAKRELAEMGLA